MRLAAARILTADVAMLARFYRAVTGISPIGSDEYVELRTPGATLALSSPCAANLFERCCATHMTDSTLILDFEVEDVDRERARLESIVGDWVLEPTTQPWGNRSMLFRDPDGHLLNVFARPR